jgi:hypothetical protein
MSIKEELALDSGDCLRPSEHENTRKVNCYEPYTRIVDSSPHINILLVRFHFVSQLTCSFIYMWIYIYIYIYMNEGVVSHSLNFQFSGVSYLELTTNYYPKHAKQILKLSIVWASVKFKLSGWELLHEVNLSARVRGSPPPMARILRHSSQLDAVSILPHVSPSDQLPKVPCALNMTTDCSRAYTIAHLEYTW